MKLYDCQPAPSPRRARMLIAEKGLDIEIVQVDLANREQLEPWFREINPRCTAPVLELEDGTRFTENAGIAAYLEAACPEPPLLGVSSIERAMVAEWNARVEIEGLLAIRDAFRNTTPRMKGRAVTGPRNFDQIPALAEQGLQRAEDFLAMLDQRLRDSDFVAGDFFSMADITAVVAVDFAAWIKRPIPENARNLKRWHQEMQRRDSYRA
ncbi:MAG: glutathione S-transferase family protein [Sphingomonadales bacterium]